MSITSVSTPSTGHDTPAMTKHMSSLNRYREVLQQLQGTWDNLSLLSQLSGTGTDMSETRHAFGQVTSDVLDSLAAETLNKTVTAISAKAQVAVDIVVRNLFERTADIGFLATDNKLSDFLDKHLAGEADDEDGLMLQQRFAEYVKKYSVYFNVILLDQYGRVVVQLDDNNPVQASTDPLVKEALHSNAPYIEVFRHSDLVPNAASSLIYASKVHHDDADSALGVLCLCFRFENEMQGIFEHLIRQEDWCVGLLLDQDNRVIASSDHYQIPLGVALETVATANSSTAAAAPSAQDWIITRFAGRLYLAVTRDTKGYQGYMGPGWRGHVMVPLDHAFDDNVANIIAGIDAKLLGKVMRSPLLFSSTLLGIPRQAASIQSKLNQSVWNGNIWQKRDSSNNAQQNSFSKMLLWEISNTGFKTQNVIEKTVADLYQTVVSVMLENSRFFASLAVDIMDRNLYERANDCRWWALTATFQQLLAQPALSSQDQAAISKVLAYINRAYTVYDNLVVFDRNGSIVASSNPAYHALIGETISADWARAALNLRDTQEYVVSAFEPTPLYRNKSTYIYAAAIRNDEQTVGGIGIVFDSAPQFSAMLADALPRNADGSVVAGSFTLYVDGKLKVISSSSSQFSIGSDFTLQPELCKLPNGGAAFDIVLYNGNYYAVGARASSGYREYKDAQDSYQNHVTALIFIPLGKAAEINAMMDSERQLQHNQFKPASSQGQAQSADAEEYATFYIGKHWLGLPAAQIVEAIQANDIKSLPDTASVLEGMLKHQDNVVPVLNLAKLTGVEIQIPERDKQVIIVQAGPKLPKFGLLVSALGEIPAIAPEAIESLSSLFATVNIPAEGIAKVTTERGDNLLILLSAHNLITRISEAAQQMNATSKPSAYTGSEMLDQAA